MKILLAGATGAIGRQLLPLLVEEGHEVTGMTRRADRRSLIEALGGKPVVADALDRAGVFAVLNALRPDVVIHQLTDLSQRDFAANSRLRIEGTRNLVDAALAVGVQQMVAQSISWVCAAGSGPAHEGDALDLNAPEPRRAMVAAVHSLESATAELPAGIVLRYGIFYGPGTWNARDGFIVQQLRNGEIEAGDGVTSFIHVADAARATLLALDWPAGIVNIVDDEPAAGAVWLPYLARLVGAPAPHHKAGKHGWERGESNAKAHALGWEPVYPTWREGFKSEFG